MAPIALITGANSGIGFAISKELLNAPEKFHVVMAGRNLGKIDAAVSELKESGCDVSRVTILQMDVTKPGSTTKAASTVEQAFGHLDVLINNAGIAPEGPDLETMFRSTFETNVFGTALVSAAFRQLLLASQHPYGYSVYIGSKVSSVTEITDPSSWLHNTAAGSVAYRASKSALNMLAMHEQLEVKDTNLKVRIVCPGFVMSNIRGTSEEQRSGGGRAGDPADSAKLVLSVIRGERDADATKLITADGSVPW